MACCAWGDCKEPMKYFFKLAKLLTHFLIVLRLGQYFLFKVYLNEYISQNINVLFLGIKSLYHLRKGEYELAWKQVIDVATSLSEMHIVLYTYIFAIMSSLEVVTTLVSISPICYYNLTIIYFIVRTTRLWVQQRSTTACAKFTCKLQEVFYGFYRYSEINHLLTLLTSCGSWQTKVFNTRKSAEWKRKQR